MPQPDALQLSKGKVCSQQKHVIPAPFKHRFLRVCQMVRLTLSLGTQQSYRHLNHHRSVRVHRAIHGKCSATETADILISLTEITNLRGGGCAMPMPCAYIQHIAILSQGVVILKHSYLDLKCEHTTLGFKMILPYFLFFK